MAATVIIYAVRIRIPRTIERTRVVRYLKREHVPALLRQPGFLSAEVRSVDDDSVLIVEYRILGYRSLDRYLKSAAPALRADFTRELGDAVHVTREVMSPLFVLKPKR